MHKAFGARGQTPYFTDMAAIKNIRPHDLFSRDDLFSRAQWARLTAPSAIMGPLLVAHCWGVILGGMPTGTPVGADRVPYRNYHLHHHKFAQQAEDPDLVLSSPFPVSRDRMRQKIIRDLTGQTFFKQRVLPLQSRQNSPNCPGVNKKFLAANIAIFAACVVAGYWWAYVALWGVWLATWTPLVTRLRNIAEHACVGTDDDPWGVARTTIASPFERAFIAPYWVNYHSEHHLFMYVPCSRLAGLHKALRKENHTDKMTIADGYRPVFRQAVGL